MKSGNQCLIQTTLRHSAEALLRRIEDYTPASFISVKDSALTWHFRDADPDFAYSSAQDARQALDDILLGSPMEVLMGSEAIHVRPRGVHKGAAVAEILRRLTLGGAAPEYVLCIGDDRTDEEMFDYVNSAAYSSKQTRHPIGATTVTVGRKTTKASFFLSGVSSVVDLLERLCVSSEQQVMLRD
jgi:trehalose 6-phosphate synthase/phosphatase